MFYQIYSQIRDSLKGIETPLELQWFNSQYEGTIYKTPIAFIEFPERLSIAEAYKGGSRAPLLVRLHIVTTATMTQDGVINDEVILDHEALAIQVSKALNGLPIDFNGNPARPLSIVGWQHFQKWRGWMVTFIDVATKVQP